AAGGEFVAQVPGDVGRGLERGDAVQLRLDRRDAGGFDLRLVHAGGVQVADQLLDAGGAGLGGGGLDDAVAGGLGALVQHLEAAPAGLVPRHRIGGQPLAVDEVGEVVADVLGGVDVGHVEGGERRQLGLGGGGGAGLAGFGVGLLAAGQRGGDGKGQQQD